MIIYVTRYMTRVMCHALHQHVLRCVQGGSESSESRIKQLNDVDIEMSIIRVTSIV